MTNDEPDIPTHEAAQFSRIAPHDIDAEMCVLASMILNPREIVNVMLLINRDSFYSADHQIMFDCITSLHAADKPIDSVILRDELKKRNLLEEVGGVAYIGKILDSVPSAAHIMHYAEIVRDKSLLRQLISASNDALRDAYAPHEKADDLLTRSIDRLAQIAQGQKTTEIMKIGDEVEREFFRIGDKERKPLVLTGYRDFDDRTGGIELGETIIIGARPSIGKSTLARCITVRSARLKIPTALISTEEGRSKMSRNWLSAEARIENSKIRRGELDDAEFIELRDGMMRLSPLPIWFCDSAFDISKIRSIAGIMVAKHGIKLLIIDHMHRINGPGKTPYERVSYISDALSQQGKELNVAQIVTAQLNRELTGRDNHRPTMQDLRQSGNIEQNADGVCLLHREDYWHTDDDSERTGILEIDIAKWRDGRRAGKPVLLKTDLKHQRFDDCEPGFEFSGSGI